MESIYENHVLLLSQLFCWTNKKGSCPLQQKRKKKWWIDLKTTWHSSFRLICFTCIFYLTSISKVYLTSATQLLASTMNIFQETFPFSYFIRFSFDDFAEGLLCKLWKCSWSHSIQLLQFNTYNKLYRRIKIVRNFFVFLD